MINLYAAEDGAETSSSELAAAVWIDLLNPTSDEVRQVEDLIRRLLPSLAALTVDFHREVALGFH
ncbi:hypothetical protein [Bosea sp. ASV33]|uniref:hypothetical protein n=1 Tax=Bosea sp. ASV33 TaxID=2795106 RepID=UPI0018EB2F7C|nr:hypothetical protein [Bosea sp. ASV33]